ncbi:MAG TPA: glycine zipper 2TM domain-containing protein [Caulobacteraceae bacterium]|nr:glycine zipper 2TM domain-containing protein [Caulobacteraceae bacterium]
MTRSRLTKGLVAGAAAVATLTGAAAIPGAASAQTYGSTYYDQCQRSTVTRSTVGGLAGAAIGAFAGSKMAARGVRTEGAVLGGLLGAALGTKVGKDSAACAPGYAAPYAARPAPAYPAGTPYTGAPYSAQPYGY